MIIKRKWLAACCVALVWWAANVNAAVLEHRHVQDVLAWLGNYQPQALHDGKRLAFPALIEALDTHRVVFVGETHDRYDHHLNQLAILQALHRRNPQVAIGVEWFQQPFQPVVPLLSAIAKALHSLPLKEVRICGVPAEKYHRKLLFQQVARIR